MNRVLKKIRRFLRFQFALRSLLVVVTVISVCLAYYTHQARQQKRIVETIIRSGGYIRYDFEYYEGMRLQFAPPHPDRFGLRKLLGDDFFFDVAEVLLGGPPLSERSLPKGLLESVGQLPNLQELDLTEVDIKEADLSHLKGLSKLRRLSLDKVTIVDGGLEPLRELKQLKVLKLRKTTGFKNEDLEILNGMTYLDFLSLEGTAITDDGLKHLVQLPNLRSLWISNTQITDRGIEHLKRMPSLSYISFRGTKITKDGARYLKKSAPNLSCDHWEGL